MSVAEQIGHNQPDLKSSLELQYEEVIQRAGELIAAFDRAPKEISDDETQGKMGDFVKQIGACVKTAEANRKNEKEPHLEAGRIVDSVFKSVMEPLNKAKKSIENRMGVYARDKAETERRRLAAEAEERRKESERLAAEAATDSDLDKAVEAENTAIELEEKAAAKPADHARVRGDFGSVATLRTEWGFEITNKDEIDLTALRPYLSPDAIEKAIRAYVGQGGRDLSGVRIFEKQTTVVR